VNTVLFVFPDSYQPDYTWERMLRLAEEYFPASEYQKTFAALKNSAAFEVPSLIDRGLISFDPTLFSNAHIVVAAEDLFDKLDIPASIRQYSLHYRQQHVLLRLRNQQIDGRDYRHLDAHTYNRNADKNTDNAVFFPYGHMFREYGMGGPSDAFGFRIPLDTSLLIDRPPHHKLIVVLGGSSVWGFCKFYDETFSTILEGLLQTACDAMGKGKKVTVLNFGQGKSVVLNQIITYLLHVERLRPDLVISHDGGSDVLYGLYSEPLLLERDICAPKIYEAWSQKLNDRTDVAPRLGKEVSPQVTNLPCDIIRSYINRKLQLDRVVRASGAKHLFALQPVVWSKERSKQEQENLRLDPNSQIFPEALQQTSTILDQLSQELSILENINILDFHRAFSVFGRDVTLFQDYVHTTPLGEQYIAHAYASKIINNSLI
jgi:hypothetical protein